MSQQRRKLQHIILYTLHIIWWHNLLYGTKHVTTCHASLMKFHVVMVRLMYIVLREQLWFNKFKTVTLGIGMRRLKTTRQHVNY